MVIVKSRNGYEIDLSEYIKISGINNIKKLHSALKNINGCPRRVYREAVEKIGNWNSDILYGFPGWANVSVFKNNGSEILIFVPEWTINSEKGRSVAVYSKRAEICEIENLIKQIRNELSKGNSIEA